MTPWTCKEVQRCQRQVRFVSSWVACLCSPDREFSQLENHTSERPGNTSPSATRVRRCTMTQKLRRVPFLAAVVSNHVVHIFFSHRSTAPAPPKPVVSPRPRCETLLVQCGHAENGGNAVGMCRICSTEAGKLSAVLSYVISG